MPVGIAVVLMGEEVVVEVVVGGAARQPAIIRNRIEAPITMVLMAAWDCTVSH